ncbi:MAG: DUF5615 family PIN-like protein [Bacteroidia bacterium]
MKLLLDQNISYRVVKKVLPYFEEVKHLSQVGLINAKDIEIWLFAKNNEYLIVTHDEDFDEIFALNGFPPKIIKLNTTNLSNQETANLLIKYAAVIGEFWSSEEIGLLSFTD